jgi:carbon-monoxide dehydrogenase small subunit
MKKIDLKVNGEIRTIIVEPTTTLLEALRDQLGLKSPKCGCDRGDCGSCTVLLDGKSVRSCLILAIETENQEIVTLEGTMKDQDLTPIQKALYESNAFQCGFCAPGMIMSLSELLEKNKKPTEEEIKEAISGNLCRCTGYTPIIEAVKKLVNENKI